MNKLSSLLFAAGFGLFAPIFSFTSCGDNSDTPEVNENKAIAQGAAGTYKVEISMTGDIEKYVPGLIYDGCYGHSNNVRLNFLADSLKNVVFSAPEVPKDLRVIPISEEGDLLSHYSVECRYEANPNLWDTALTITSRPNSHGFRVAIWSDGERALAGSRIALRFRSYFNGKLIEDKVIKAKSLLPSEIKTMEDAFIIVELGNPKLNYQKYFEK